jgi:hypothetical protein
MAAGDNQTLLPRCNTHDPVGAQSIAQNDLCSTVGDTINFFLDKRGHLLRHAVQSLIQVPDVDTVFFTTERFQLWLYYATGHNYAGNFFVSLHCFSTPFRLKIFAGKCYATKLLAKWTASVASLP